MRVHRPLLAFFILASLGVFSSGGGQSEAAVLAPAMVEAQVPGSSPGRPAGGGGMRGGNPANLSNPSNPMFVATYTFLVYSSLPSSDQEEATEALEAGKADLSYLPPGSEESPGDDASLLAVFDDEDLPDTLVVSMEEALQVGVSEASRDTLGFLGTTGYSVSQASAADMASKAASESRSGPSAGAKGLLMGIVLALVIVGLGFFLPDHPRRYVALVLVLGASLMIFLFVWFDPGVRVSSIEVTLTHLAHHGSEVWEDEDGVHVASTEGALGEVRFFDQAVSVPFDELSTVSFDWEDYEAVSEVFAREAEVDAFPGLDRFLSFNPSAQ